MTSLKNRLKETKKKVNNYPHAFNPECFRNYVLSFEKAWKSAQKGKIGIRKDLFLGGNFRIDNTNKKELRTKLEVIPRSCNKKKIMPNVLSLEKKEIKKEIFALYALVFSRLNYFEFNYEKMASKLIKNLQRIYRKINDKNIDIFEKALAETFKKRRHQEGLNTKLPEAHRDCKEFNIKISGLSRGVRKSSGSSIQSQRECIVSGNWSQPLWHWRNFSQMTF